MKEVFNRWKFWKSEHLFRAIEFEAIAILVWGFILEFPGNALFVKLASIVLFLLLFSVMIEIVLGVKEISKQGKEDSLINCSLLRRLN